MFNVADYAALKIFLIYNSGGHLVWRNGISKRHYMYEKQICERILDLDSGSAGDTV